MNIYRYNLKENSHVSFRVHLRLNYQGVKNDPEKSEILRKTAESAYHH